MESKYEYYTNDTNVGERVHPRNWMYRVALWTSIFDEGKRLKYNSSLIPTIENGRCCLRVDKEKLKEEFPEIYKSVITIIRFLDAKRLNS